MATKKTILCDTNILIEYFHEDQKIVQELDFLGFERLAISAVTVAEIYFGMRKRETDLTKEILRKFTCHHFDKEISKHFVQFMLGYRSHRISIPDALIAATAISNQVELFTLNRKDFDFIEGLKLYNPKF